MNAPLELPPRWFPRFKSNLQVIPLGMAGFCVLSEFDTFLLEGVAMNAVVPLLDGRRTFADVLQTFPSGSLQSDAHNTLRLLYETGYLEDSLTAGPPAINQVCNELNVTFSEAAALLGRRTIQLRNLSTVSHEGLRDLLRRSGFRLEDPGDLIVVLCDDYRDSRLELLNQTLVRERRPWLIAKATGFNSWLGPLFHSPRTACWACMDHRLTHNRHLVRYAERTQGGRQPIMLNLETPHSSLFQTYGGLITQLLRILVDRPHAALNSHILVTDTLNHRVTTHPVVKRPECPVCGNSQVSPGAAAYAPQANSLAAPIFGGHRREAPEVTFLRLQHQISPLTGIVSSIDPSPYNHTTPLRVYTAGHNFALANDTPTAVKDSVRSLSSGKGRTDAEARTSALCEALERYSGIFQGYEPRRSATFHELGTQALDPRSCLLFSETQYHDRDQWLARRSRFQVVPHPFNPSARIDWSPVKRFGSEEVFYLPTAQLYYGYPYDEQQFYCWADSNGCASGTSFEDACLQGLLELVERDAVAIWWYNQYQVPGLRPEQMGDEYYTALSSYYRSIDREFWALDLTHDLGVPVFCALNRRVRGPTEDIIMGFGAHIDPRIALNRAVTEMNQFMPAVLNVLPDGTTAYGFDDHEAQRWWRTARLAEKRYLQPLPGHDSTALNERAARLSVQEELDGLVACLRRESLEVYVQDQTRGEAGLPVVRMIVPGIRHFWARYAPGRLYDVPVKLKHLNAPRAESELNPVPVFI